jgi:hypothetical protein
MHNESQEVADVRADEIRAGVEAADDTGMVAQQELLHVVGDAESSGDEREVAP